MATKKPTTKKATRKYTKRVKPNTPRVSDIDDFNRAARSYPKPKGEYPKRETCQNVRPEPARRFECTNDGDDRFNILLGARKLRELAIQIALHGSTESMRLQGHIHWLNYFADRITIWAGVGGRYEPSKEVLREVSGVIYNRAWWDEAHTEMRATPNKLAQSVADALHGEFGDYFDGLLELSLSTSNGREPEHDTHVDSPNVPF